MFHRSSAVPGVIALALGLGLSACGDHPNNRSLYSIKQPVVERSTQVLDLAAGAGGLPVSEQRRLDGWLAALSVGHGDRVALEGLSPSDAVRADVAALLARRGLLLAEGAPIGEGVLDPGTVRVTISRSRAHVPGCPDWSDWAASNLGNRTSDNFGCAVNSNIAAMIADPEHLLTGAAETGAPLAAGSTKAIRVHQARVPSGSGALPQISSSKD